MYSTTVTQKQFYFQKEHYNAIFKIFDNLICQVCLLRLLMFEKFEHFLYSILVYYFLKLFKLFYFFFLVIASKIVKT